MDKTEAWRNMNNKRYEYEGKIKELGQAKEQYRESLVDDTVNHIKLIIEEYGEISDRDLKLFLGDLALQTIQLYSK